MRSALDAVRVQRLVVWSDSACWRCTSAAVGASARRFAACRLLLVSYKPLARETAMSAVGDLDLFNTRYAGGNLAKHVGRRTAKKINRGRGKQGRKKKPEAHQCGVARGVQGGPVLAFRRRSRARRAAPSARREESCQEGGPPRFKREAIAGDRLKSKFTGIASNTPCPRGAGD